MAKTIIVAGYGPGISTAVAEKFGKEGFSVALVARNADRLGEGVKALTAKGIKAAAFPADLADPNAVRAVVEKIRGALGPITVVQWSAYATDAGDLLAADAASLHRVFDVAVTGLVTTVQAALPDLKAQKDGAVLVTNGGFGYFDSNVDKAVVAYNASGLAIANAAKHKLVGLLAEKLKADGVYVGEVVVLSSVKGTAWDNGTATIAPSSVADKFWELYQARTTVSADVG
jgi:short-subunit dehydrogenase